jgi:hypothetical protein
MSADWKGHERDVARLLGLDQTTSSGNRFHDPGDVVDRSHSLNNDFAIIADCKCTEKLSATVKLIVLNEWRERAAEMGKRFIMPLRFWPRGANRPSDFVLVPLDDFAELLHKAGVT